MALFIEGMLMRSTIKYGHNDKKYRCRFCRRRLPTIAGIGIHLARKHSHGKLYKFKIAGEPNSKGSYYFRVIGPCGCGCGEIIEYPRKHCQTPWVPDHAPPYYLSGHKSRVLPPNSGNFKKGHINWNAGLKGMGICKPNSGSFKKGNIPKTDRGGLYTQNGQVYEWTGEYQPSGPRKYKARSRRIMEEMLSRPLRSNEVVIHLDGKVSNDDPINLKVITRGENATRNRWKGHKAKKKVKKKVKEKVMSDIVDKDIVEIMEEIIEIERGPFKVVEPICGQCKMLIIPPGSPCPRC